MRIMDSLLNLFNRLHLLSLDDEFDLADDGAEADWQGLSEAERLALSLDIHDHFLGRGGVRTIGLLGFYTALWLQFCKCADCHHFCAGAITQLTWPLGTNRRSTRGKH